MNRFFLTLSLVFCFGIQILAAEPFIIAVMDPLAKELACDCIDGFAQRDYQALADRLKQTGNPAFAEIELVFATSIPMATAQSSKKRIDTIIGKDTVVRAELQKAKIAATAIARLTNKHGSTDFTGLVVAAADDPAKSVADLKNHQVLFGPPECEEKHAAAIKLFEKHGITVPKQPEIAERCVDAGLTILENESDRPIAAVVSEYALALLEGCKTIEKGALRVIDKTEPVPFISVFVMETIDKRVINELYIVLVECHQDSKLLEVLETKEGFVPYLKKTVQDTNPTWESLWQSFPIAKPEGEPQNK